LRGKADIFLTIAAHSPPLVPEKQHHRDGEHDEQHERVQDVRLG
jgi:hypothetical protein